MATISIRNLVKTTTTIQDLMGLEAIQKASRDSKSFQALTGKITGLIRSTFQSADRILQESSQDLTALGIRSRRAYQWLKFLNNQENLEIHLDALYRINLFLPKIQRAKKYNQHQVEFVFYNLGSLYKISGNTSSIAITAQEILTHAPDKVLIAILESALGNSDPARKKVIHEYTFSPAYQNAREILEYLGIKKGSLAAGNHQDLQNSFNRVNQNYFEGIISEPHLVWSSRLTHRKFGHYQWDTDTVMVSRSLDHPRVPDYVVDYVMFHELLHKKLGAKIVNQRRAVHTSAFRQEETKFKKFDQAQKYLNKLSRKRK